MPELSTIGLVQPVVLVDGSHVFAASDCDVCPSASWTSGTFMLPGPNSTPERLPSDGDFYRVGDPLGKVGSSHHLIVDGGGYTMLGADTITISLQFARYEFTFSAEAQAWIVCNCTVQGG